MKLFVVGSLNMDVCIRAPRLPEQGMTLLGDGFMTNPGGKGGNQAVACAKLGGEAYMVGCVGGAFGDELLSGLDACGVHTDFVVKREDVPSGAAVILVTDGDNRIILDRGANALVDRALIDRALVTASKGDFLLVQLEIGRAEAEYAVQRGRALGMTTLLNPAPAAELGAETLACCDYFLPNQTEAQFYTGIYPEDGESVKACLQALSAMGIECPCVTLGARGAAYLCGGETKLVAAYPAEAVDTTAAGDTFVGAFAVRLSEGASVGEAMKFANRAAAVAVSRRGAQCSIPFRSELK